MKYYTYVLKSQRFDKYYIGSTSDLKKRIEFHNSSRARYTKRYQPWVLLHSEEFESRQEAVKREYELKRYKKIKYLLDSLGF